MKTWIVDAKQGTQEWHAHRAKSFNASDLACAMGIDPNGRRRSDLVRQYATGIEREFSDYVLANVIAPGHEIEVAARAIVEERIGESLYPVVIAGDLDGMILSASMDGITADDAKSFECKRKNNGLLEAVASGIVPECYRPQMEQGMMLSVAEVCLFTVSDGTEEGTIFCEYRSDPELRAKIGPTWRQFAEDVANYQHIDTAETVVGTAPEGLPALFVQIEGRVTASNLDKFSKAAQDLVEGIKTELSTDQDFADADRTAKWLKEGEDRLKTVKDQAQAQAQDIDTLFRAIDKIADTMRIKRLFLEKRVKERKDDIRSQAVMDAQRELSAHINKIRERLGGDWIPVIQARFAEVIKGLKTLDSMRDKLDTELARAKIEANETADRIDINRKQLTVEANDWSFLFPDFAAVCQKDSEDFANLVQSRISQHNERMRVEAERAEQATKIKADAEAKAAAYMAQREAMEKQALVEQEHKAILRDAAHVAVIYAEKVISDFLASRTWHKGEENRIRAVLIEYEKFKSVAMISNPT